MLHSHVQAAAAKEGGMYRRIRKRTVVNIVCVCVLVRISWGEGEVGRTHAYNMTGRRPKLMSIRSFVHPLWSYSWAYHTIPRAATIFSQQHAFNWPTKPSVCICVCVCVCVLNGVTHHIHTHAIILYLIHNMLNLHDEWQLWTQLLVIASQFITTLHLKSYKIL